MNKLSAYWFCQTAGWGIYAAALKATPSDGAHTGLNNARHRLRHLCGENATLELSEHAGTVAAIVTIPAQV